MPKISDLPEAVAVNNDDYVPIVQSGVTKQAPVSLLPTTGASGPTGATGPSNQYTDVQATATVDNVVLADGQLGVEIDTNRVKIGDGSTAWNDLEYVVYPPGDRMSTLSGSIDTKLAEQRQDEARRGSTFGSANLLDTPVVDMAIGDSVNWGAGATIGTNDWLTLVTKSENLRAGLSDPGPGFIPCSDGVDPLFPVYGFNRMMQVKRQVTDAVFNSTTTVTSATAIFSAYDVGRSVTGTSVPAATTISAYVSPTEVTLSAATTATGTGKTINITAEGAQGTHGPNNNGWILQATNQVIGDTRTFDVAEIIYTKQTAGANFQVSVDGGSTWSADIVTAGTEGAVASWESTTQGLHEHIMLIKQTSAGTVKINGWVPHVMTSTRGVVLHNCAVGGTDTDYWTTNRGWETHMALYTPRRLYIDLGVGDAGLLGDTVANMVARYTTLLQRAQAASPLTAIFLTGTYYANGGSLTNVPLAEWRDEWLPAIEQLALDNGCVFISLFDRFGDCSDTGDPYSITMDGGIHFGPEGHRALADFMIERLGGPVVAGGATDGVIRTTQTAAQTITFPHGGKVQIDEALFFSQYFGFIGVYTAGDNYPRIGLIRTGQLAFGDGATHADTQLTRASLGQFSMNGGLTLAGTAGAGYLDITEQSADPAAPAANGARLFCKDNGAGKTQLCVRFNTGAVQVIATQP